MMTSYDRQRHSFESTTSDGNSGTMQAPAEGQDGRIVFGYTARIDRFVDLPIDDLGLATRTQSNAQGRLAAEKEIKQDKIKAPAADIKERLLTWQLIEAALSINGFIFRSG